MNKDVPQEKGFEEDIGRKGSENNVSFEVFSKEEKEKNHVQSLCNKRNLHSPKRA